MALTDLFFLLSVMVLALGLLGLLVALVARRWKVVRGLGLGLGFYTILYGLLLVGVSLDSPQRVMAMHQARCFDDWCASIERVEQRSGMGTVQPHGGFYLVTVQVTSRAKGISQRALDAAVYLLDSRGTRYNPSPDGQRALQAVGLAGQPLNSRVDAGGSFDSIAVFDIPPETSGLAAVIAHGAFPGLIIIGDEQSFLHKPTIVPLN